MFSTLSRAIGKVVFTDSAKRSRDQQVQALRREGESGGQSQDLPLDNGRPEGKHTLESMAAGAEWRGIEGDRERRGIATTRWVKIESQAEMLLPSGWPTFCGTTRAPRRSGVCRTRHPPSTADRLAERTFSFRSPNHYHST